MKEFETKEEYAAYFQGWEAATHYTAAFRDGLRTAKELLNTNTAPRRGRWEDITENGETAFRCSTCHMYLAFWPDWKYCPNCGAEMDGLKVKGENKVAVVRCGDCIYYVGNNGGRPTGVCKWREDEDPDPDDFCSVGETENEE